MKKLVILVPLLLAGCASLPIKSVDMKMTREPAGHIAKRDIKPAPVIKPSQPIALPKADDQPATFKRRWYDKFKIHPKWFH